MRKPAFRHRAVDHVGRTLDKTTLVGVLDAQDERAACVPGDEIGIKRGAQVADVHVAGGRGGKTGAHLAVRDLGFHFFKILHINRHRMTSREISV